jgi:hypothetical protein
MSDGNVKRPIYRGIRFVLKERDGSWGYRITSRMEGLGFASEDAAREGAEKAIDRKLNDEAGK